VRLNGAACGAEVTYVTFLKVYLELGSCFFVSARTNKRHHQIEVVIRAPPRALRSFWHFGADKQSRDSEGCQRKSRLRRCGGLGEQKPRKIRSDALLCSRILPSASRRQASRAVSQPTASPSSSLGRAGRRPIEKDGQPCCCRAQRDHAGAPCPNPARLAVGLTPARA